jgi:hypothetical protein
VRDCNPLLEHFESRAFEISRAIPKADYANYVAKCVASPDANDLPGCIGATWPDDALPQSPPDPQLLDYACKISSTSTTGVTPGGEGSGCIFENLTARFAIYRGNIDARDPTLPKDASQLRTLQRDYSFSWSTVGGFSILTASIVDQTTSVSPRSMVFVPELGQLAVVDGNLAGLSFVDVKSLGVSRQFY